MRKITVLQKRVSKKLDGAYNEVKTGKNAFFHNRVSNIIGNRYRSHESRMNEVGMAINDFYKVGGKFTKKDVASLYGMVHAESKYADGKGDKIANYEEVKQIIGNIKEGLRYEFGSIKNDNISENVSGLETQVISDKKVVGSNDNGRLETKTNSKYMSAAGIRTGFMASLAAATVVGATVFFGGCKDKAYNPDTVALEVMGVGNNAPVVNLCPVNDSNVPKVVYDVNTDVNDANVVSVDISKDSNSVSDLEKVTGAREENKRPSYYDYKFGEYPDARKAVADKKWKKGDKFGGAITRVESGLAYVNDIVEFGVARPVVGSVGGIVEKVKKMRLLEHIVNPIWEAPFRKAKVKDNSNENSFEVGYQKGEDVAAFVMDGTVGGEGFDGLHADVLSLKPVEGVKKIYERESSKMNGHLKLAEIAVHYLLPWNWFSKSDKSGSSSGMTGGKTGSPGGIGGSKSGGAGGVP